MPVTKTAKRALRGSARKALVNTKIIARLEAAVRIAKRGKAEKKVLEAISFADRAAKKKVIHKNKAARIKSSLSKLLSTPKISTVKKTKPGKKSSVASSK